MENLEPSSNHSMKSQRRNSNGHLSISDTDSTTSQVETFHSPWRSDSPLRSDDSCFQQEHDKSGNGTNRELVAVDKFYSPLPSPPGKPNLPASSPSGRAKLGRPWPHSEKPTSESTKGKNKRDYFWSEDQDFPEKNGRGARAPPITGLNRYVREEPPPGVTKVGKVGGDIGGVEEGYGGGSREDEVGGERRSRTAVEAILNRSKAEKRLKKAALFFRVLEGITCLISFSVMAADKTQGWSGDSYDRYKEYRYCFFMNIIGFVYSGLQACDIACSLVTEKHVISGSLRCHFSFSMDQILAYLLISASSSAATRVEDWILNWGSDDFTLLASASIGMSFVAFLVFAISSLISGYSLCKRNST